MKEEEEEEEEADALVLLPLSSRPPSTSTTAVVFPWLVTLVTMHFTLCSFVQDKAAWHHGPVWTRMTVRRSSSLCIAGLLVFYTSRCVPVRCRLAQDTPPHGRYAPKGQLCALRIVFFLWSLSAGPPLGLHHGRYGPEGQLCVEMVINILVVAQRQFPLVLTVQKTIVIPQLQFLDKVIDDPVVRVQVLPDRSHARCVQRAGACGSDYRKNLRIPTVAVHQGRRQFLVVVQRPIPWSLRP